MKFDPNATDTPPARRGPRPGWVAPVLVLVFLAVLMLRHDFWNWESAEPLLFGIIPVGLWWQALVSICASLLLWLCVRLAWPYHLEEQAQPRDPAPPVDSNSQVKR